MEYVFYGLVAVVVILMVRYQIRTTREEARLEQESRDKMARASVENRRKEAEDKKRRELEAERKKATMPGFRLVMWRNSGSDPWHDEIHSSQAAAYAIMRRAMNPMTNSTECFGATITDQTDPANPVHYRYSVDFTTYEPKLQ